ncbi:MAG: substrate-binding domain-containing protein [Eubacteriales bacterium]|nr:substrate-binding domain-containing protein [Eubacteriales bacterium]
MSFFKRVICIFAFIILLLSYTSCQAETVTSEKSSVTSADTSTKTVVFSIFNDNNPWVIALAKDLQSTATTRKYKFIITNAEGDSEKQLSDIEELLNQQPDILLLSAVDTETGGKCLEAAKEANVPVILVARNAQGLMGQDYISLIACDYEAVGYTQGMSLIRLFGDSKCNIVELAGNPGASNTNSIASGFRRAIEIYSNFTIVTTKNYNYSMREALDSMESVIQSSIDFQAVFCHSDVEALGAIQALKTAGMTPGCNPDKGEIIITSNCGFEDAIKAVMIGELYNTIDLNARMGDLVFNTIEKYWNGEVITPRILITFDEITIDNASEWIGKGY